MKLRKQVIDVAGQALENRTPCRFSWAVGKCEFAVNRRENNEQNVPQMRKAGKLKGPVDHSVPTLAVTDHANKMIAVFLALPVMRRLQIFINGQVITLGSLKSKWKNHIRKPSPCFGTAAAPIRNRFHVATLSLSDRTVTSSPALSRKLCKEKCSQLTVLSQPLTKRFRCPLGRRFLCKTLETCFIHHKTNT